MKRNWYSLPESIQYWILRVSEANYSATNYPYYTQNKSIASSSLDALKRECVKHNIPLVEIEYQ